MKCHYPDLGSRLVMLYPTREVCFRQSEALPSMEFLHSFLRRHFAWKPTVASQNESCLLRLPQPFTTAILNPMSLFIFF